MSRRYADTINGWAIFVGIVLLIAGTFALIQGIAALNNKYLFVTSSQGLIVWNLNGFGWYHIVVGCLMILTSLGLFAMSQWARILAVILVVINAISQIFWLTTTPFWSILMITLDVIIVYQLTMRWGGTGPEESGSQVAGGTQRAGDVGTVSGGSGEGA